MRRHDTESAPCFIRSFQGTLSILRELIDIGFQFHFVGCFDATVSSSIFRNLGKSEKKNDTSVKECDIRIRKNRRFEEELFNITR